MRYISALGLICLLVACNGNSSKMSGETNTTQTVVQPNAQAANNCDQYDRVLNGAFATPYQEGTMTWFGGREGRVEISGLDYNDMTCTYVIGDCTTGAINMHCNGSPFDAVLNIISQDTFIINNAKYHRVN